MESKDNVVTNNITLKLQSLTKNYKVILNKGIKKKLKLENYIETLYDLTCHKLKVITIFQIKTNQKL